MSVLLISWLAVYHAFYLSTSYIDIGEGRRWVATIRFFYDDLEDALQNEFQKRPNLKIDHPDLHKEKLTFYLSKHFKVSSIGQNLPFEIFSMSSQEDIYEILIKGLTQWQPGKCIIENDLLVEVFPGQKNIIRIMTGNDTLLFDFSKRKSRDEFICP